MNGFTMASGVSESLNPNLNACVGFKKTLSMSVLFASSLVLSVGLSAFAQEPSVSLEPASTTSEQDTWGQRAVAAPEKNLEATDISSSADEGFEKADEAPRNLKLSAEDPTTGKAVNIEINSNKLKYNAETGLYEAIGSAYMIIPEEQTEVLADKITFDTKQQTMLATGKVFIINRGTVISTTRSVFNTDKNYSYYEHPRTVTDSFRMAAENAQRYENLTVIKKGRLLLGKEQMRNVTRKITRTRFAFGNGSEYSYYSADWARKYLINNNAGVVNNLALYDSLDDIAHQPEKNKTRAQGYLEPNEDEPQITQKVISPADVEAADYSDNNGRLRIKVHRADITRGADGFDEIVFKRTTFKLGKVPVFFSPTGDFGYDRNTGYLAYLGPEFGYDLDNGGYYLGPGFDHRFAKGWLKFTPFLTYGSGRRRSTSASSADLVEAGPGIGAQLSYLSQNTKINLSYNTTLADARVFIDQRLFGRQGTRFRAGYNQVMNNGFYGSERPNWIAEVRDLRRKYLFNYRLLAQSYLSAGLARDEFYPTGQSRFFIAPTSPNPITTTRLQAQFSVLTSRPFIHIKDYLAVGAIARGRFAMYGTGDHLGVLQVGPYANLTVWRFFTQATYLSGLTSGRSPFVFDGFYGGNNSMRLVNSVDISKNFTLGIAQGFNLSRSNNRDALVVGRQVFASFGPDAVKFSVAYDIIQKRSYFGFTFNPEGGNLIVNFDRVNYFQPGYDEDAMRPAESVIAPTSSGPPGASAVPDMD
jgi:hypothetical protein